MPPSGTFFATSGCTLCCSAALVYRTDEQRRLCARLHATDYANPTALAIASKREFECGLIPPLDRILQLLQPIRVVV